MTIYALHQALIQSDYLLRVDLHKMDALSHAHMSLDDVLPALGKHLEEHRVLMVEMERLMQPRITKELPFTRL